MSRAEFTKLSHCSMTDVIENLIYIANKEKSIWLLLKNLNTTSAFTWPENLVLHVTDTFMHGVRNNCGSVCTQGFYIYDWVDHLMESLTCKGWDSIA